MKTILRLLLKLSVVLVFLLFYSCQPKHKQDQFKIGIIFPLSGNFGYVGEMELNGIKMALDDYNVKNPTKSKIELIVDDSQGKPDLAVTIAKKMISIDKVDVIFTSLSSVTLAVTPVVKESGTILIGCCMHPDFFKGSNNIFRFYLGVEQESNGFMKYYKNLDRAKNIKTGILYADVPNVRSQVDDYLRPELKKLGLDYSLLEPYQLTDKEFRDKALKIKMEGITNLLILGYGFEYPNIFKALKEVNLLGKVDILGGWGFLYHKLPPEDVEGIKVVGPKYVFDQPEEVAKFYADFKKENGFDANFDAVLTYSATELLLNGVDKLSSTRSDLKINLMGISDFESLLGRTNVLPEGDVNFEIGIGVFKNKILQSTYE
jgi:branched-chain amino acid transport system substrate-binding protein